MISIDGTDIKKVRWPSLRRQIAMVTQQTILFNDTVYNNIAYGDITKTREEVEQAAVAAYAHDFIKQLPKGFDTVIGEQGVRLSRRREAKDFNCQSIVEKRSYPHS